MDKIKSLLQSRRFYAAVAGLLAVFTEGFGIPIAASNLELIVGVVAAWIIGDSMNKTE
jgi:hypothetical protein